MKLFKNGLAYLRAHPQLGMTVILVFVIPVAFIVSSQQFIDAGRDNQENLESEYVGILHDVFASYVRAVDFDIDKIQSEIHYLGKINPDIFRFEVLKADKDGNFTIVASLNENKVGTLLAGDDRKLLVDVLDGVLVKDYPYLYRYAEDGIRYWKAYRYIQDEDGEIYIALTQTSLEAIDILFYNRITVAYYWLIAMLVVVMLLIFRHLKLIDYSYLYRETKKTNEMKDMFTNMIAHELRAPLTAMRGYASMIRQDHSVSDDIKKYAENIEEASGRLVLIVSDLLDVARIQSGKLKIEPKKNDIQRTVTSVLSAMKSVADEKNIELKKEGLTGALVANIDDKRLHQALTNLVSNAVKYTPAGGAITLELSDLQSRVEIRVKDTGMGISADNQKKLFAPFFRVNTTEVDAIVGTGLGMWITKQLVELMKGSIGVESIKGVGTHIVITFPK